LAERADGHVEDGAADADGEDGDGGDEQRREPEFAEKRQAPIVAGGPVATDRTPLPAGRDGFLATATAGGRRGPGVGGSGPPFVTAVAASPPSARTPSSVRPPVASSGSGASSPVRARCTCG
jgi:hypothetical protein